MTRADDRGGTAPDANTLVMAGRDVAALNDPQAVVWEKMARRLERYDATGEQPAPRAERMCATCPFRGADERYRREGALVPAQDWHWPCHTDETEHCAGHHAAQARFGKPTVSALRARAAAESAR